MTLRSRERERVDILPPAPARSHILLAAALVTLAIVLAWSNSFDGPFVLDDLLNVSHNETIRRLFDWRVLAPPTSSSAGGRPVLNVSFAVNYALHGNTVRGYHLGNLVIHVLAALTLLGLVRRTLLTAPLRERFGSVALSLATAAALLWALHPLQTASVTYISQRAEALMGLFYLLVLYCVARGWNVLAVVACALGAGTKEVIVTAPLLVLLYDRTFLAGSFREAWRQRRALYVGLAAASALLVFLMRGIGARGVAAAGVSPLDYALIECRVVLGYLRLILWPHPLVFDYGEFAPAFARSLACGAILLALLAATVVALIRRPALGFLGAWFFLVLAPTSSVVPVTFQPMGENRVYLPLAAAAVGAVAFVATLAPRRWWLALLAVAAGFALLTARRNLDYRDPQQLWAQTLALRPDSSRAQNEYALSLAQAGRLPEALTLLERALAQRPDSSLLHRNLGLLLARNGRMADALPHFARVVQLEPELDKGRQEYGHALAALGRFPEAIEQVRAGAKLVPRDAGPHLELARLFLQTNRPADAVSEFEIAVRLAPNDSDIRNEFAATLLAGGREADALAQFAAGLRAAPDHPGLLYNYGRALINAGRPADALPLFEALVRQPPPSAAAHFALANTLAALGRLPEAMPHYEETLRIDPNLPQAREFYEMARARLSR